MFSTSLPASGQRFTNKKKVILDTCLGTIFFWKAWKCSWWSSSVNSVQICFSPHTFQQVGIDAWNEVNFLEREQDRYRAANQWQIWMNVLSLFKLTVILHKPSSKWEKSVLQSQAVLGLILEVTSLAANCTSNELNVQNLNKRTKKGKKGKVKLIKG